MKSVFISYVHEDSRIVSFLAKILEINGVDVWLDKTKLVPGQRWQAGIKTAIQNGTYFLSVYSNARASRSKSYVHEETTVAVEEIRKRPVNRTFFVPVRIDDSEIEDRPIGGGESILDLQICDLRNWVDGIKSLMMALGVENPVVDLGEPLADGIPSFIKIQSGHITFNYMDSLPEIYQGMRFSVETGWCTRNQDKNILSYLQVVAPFAKFEQINQLLGLNGMYAICLDEKISSDEASPSVFSFEQRIQIPAGTPLLDLASSKEVNLPMDIEINSSFVASGVVDGYEFSGTFDAFFQPIDIGPRININGEFSLNFEPDLHAAAQLGS